MIKKFKEEVTQLLDLIEEEISLPSSSVGGYGFELVGMSLNEFDISHLIDLVCEENESIEDSELKALLAASEVLKSRHSKQFGENDLTQEKSVRLEIKIDEAIMRIEKCYKSLSKEEKSDLVYKSLRLKHLSDDQKEKFISLLEKYKTDFIITGGRVCFLIKDEYSAFISELQDSDSLLFKKHIQFSQPVKFDGTDFNKRLVPLIRILIK